MQQVTDELRILVEAEVERAIKNIEKFDSAMDGTEKTTASFSEALSAVEKKALIMSGAVITAGGASVKFAADNQSLKSSLEVLLKDAGKAKEVFDEWKDFGASTPLSTDEIGKAGKQLLAFGVTAESVTDTMRGLGDIATATGISLGDLSTVYGQIKTQGRLFGDDIKQLQGRGIPIVQELSKQFGVSEAAIKKMVSEGKIGFNDFDKAIKAMTKTGGQFEGMMARLSKDTMGKWSTALDNGKQALASFGDLMLPLVNGVLDFATGTFEAISNLDEGTKRFILGFGGVIAVSGPAIKAITGIKTALTALNANPYMLAIGGLITGVAYLTGLFASQKEEVEDLSEAMERTKGEADRLLSSYKGMEKNKVLDKSVTKELLMLYPELSGKIKEYSTTVEEAQRQIGILHRLKSAQSEEEYNRVLLESAKAYDGIKDKIPRLTEEMFKAAKETGNFDKALKELKYAGKVVENIEKSFKKEVDHRDFWLEQYLKTELPQILNEAKKPINKELAEIGAGFEDETKRAERLVILWDLIANQTKENLYGSTEGLQDAISKLKDELDSALLGGGDVSGETTNAFVKILESIDPENPGFKSKIGKLQDELKKIETGVTITPLIDENAKKTWQQWWQEITNVDESLFGSSGKKAGNLFIKGVKDSAKEEENLAKIILEDFDMKEALEGQKETIQSALKDLFNAKNEDGSSVFGITDNSIQVLLSRIKEVNAEIKQLENNEEIKKIYDELIKKNEELGKTTDELTLSKLKQLNADEALIKDAEKQIRLFNTGNILESYKKKVEAIGKSEYDLARETLIANKATEEQLKQFDEYVKKLKGLEEGFSSFEEAFKSVMKDGLVSMFDELGIKSDELKEKAAQAIADISYAIADISFDHLVQGLSDIGYAFAQGDDAAEAFHDSMVKMAQEILNQLPNLFLQAGLQLIAQGQWALGLGFVAAGLGSAVVGGVVSGTIDREKGENKLHKNALGGVYEKGDVIPFALGGVFTNKIVTEPTLFKFAKGTGLMGEAGPEAIMPLRRGKDGSLGVAALGGEAPKVMITIINNTGEAVSQKETEGADGSRNIEIMIGQAINGVIASGKADRSLKNRFGLTVQGV